MSWQKCVTGKPYRLSVPTCVYTGAVGLHMLVLLSSLGLALPSDYMALGWLLVWRSWCCLQRYAHALFDSVLWIDAQGFFRVDEWPRNDGCSGSKSATSCALHTRLQSMPRQDSAWHYGLQTELESDLGAEQKQYTCRRTRRVPGCVALSLVCDYAKPLEILVFYRYDQRQFYQRLKRHLAYL